MKQNNNIITTLCVVIFGIFASGIGCAGGGGGGGSVSSTGGGNTGDGESGGGESGGGIVTVTQEDIANRDHTFVLSNGLTLQFTYPNAGLNPPSVTDTNTSDTLDVFYGTSGGPKYTIDRLVDVPSYGYVLNVTWSTNTTGTITGTYDDNNFDATPPVAVSGTVVISN